MFELVKRMHEKFGIQYDGEPRALTPDEFDFRMKAFQEEIDEYKEAYHLQDLEGQMDALVDLMVFILGACEKQGFNKVEEAFKRVMTANMNKELVESADESKRGHKFDLKKPEGWRAPYLKDLIKPSEHKGLLVLEGPDGCGKTTLAEYLQDNYGAYVMHSTWSEGLEKRMSEYMIETLTQAWEISRNQLVVLDRHWLSELVYADVFRGGSKRDALHGYVHQMILGLKATVIYCLPDNLLSISSRFEELKEQREEMYEDISDVVKAYAQLWDAQSALYVFKSRSNYINTVSYEGGLQNMDNFIRYDWTSDGKDMGQFIKQNFLSGEE